MLDRHLHLLAPAVAGTSNPARASSSAGGVARNVAENLALLGVRVRLCSRVGDDDAGRLLLGGLEARGVDVSAVAVAAGEATAQYVAVLDPAGDLVLGVAAMDALDAISLADLRRVWPGPGPGRAGEWVFLDCNLPVPVLAGALGLARRRATPVAVDAVSAPKVVRLAAAGTLRGIAVLFCNLDEARALLGALGLPVEDGAPAHAALPHAALPHAAALVGAGAGAAVLTLGAHGVVIADATGVRAVPAVPADVVDVTGAGDCLVAATLAGLVAGADLDDAVRTGARAAALTVASPFSVRPDLAAALAGGAPGSGPRPPTTVSG